MTAGNNDQQGGQAGAPEHRDLIVLCDHVDAIRFVSRSFAALFGASGDAWIGRRFAPCGSGDGRSAPVRFRTAAETRDGPKVIDWSLTAFASGERLYAGRLAPERRNLDVSMSTCDASAGLPETHGSATSAPAAARQDQPAGFGDATGAEAAASRYLATLSHEMRTPLSGVIGMATLLLDTDLTANQRNYAESIREAGSTLLTLINDILDYSKLKSGRFELDPSPFDPHRLIQSITELLAPKAAEKGIEIASFVDPALPRRLIADEARIRQILVNLAGNAVKFTQKGGVLIEAGLADAEGEGSDFFIRVRDTGIGIAESAQEQVFDEFERAADPAARRSEGAGLGLAISKRLALAMGGRIGLRSVLGRGSEFTFSMPLDAADAHGADAQPVARDTAAPRDALVASGSGIVREALRKHLMAFGVADVAVSRSTEDLRAHLEGSRPSLLICDQTIAAECGPDLLARAGRALALVSADAREAITVLRDRGFSGYLMKPVRGATLSRELLRGAEPVGETLSANRPDGRSEGVGAAAGCKPSPALARASSAPASGLRILLAEDNRINAVLATTLIGRAGHAVDVAHNGREAVEMAKSAVGGYHLIFMDMHMPEMDGLEATRLIRSGAAPAAQTPIIALTANAMAADRSKCMAAGMDDFLSKPFEPRDLEAMVAKWRDGRALGAAS